jgi:predicted regulator of Ras-like GTPase activity (Roadblock/LC7/MglB family)
MKEILEQLAAHPGVRLAAFVMEDGVPVHVQPGSAAASSDADGGESIRDHDALAALSAGWVLDVCSAIAPLSWDRPARMALRGAQGTLVLRRAHTAWLLVILAEGLRIEDVILAMDGTAARLERYVRGLMNEGAERLMATAAPPPALPSPVRDETQGEVPTSSFNAEQKLP